MNYKTPNYIAAQLEQKRTYGQIVSSLKQVIWVEDPLIVCPQMRAYSFAWSKAQLHRYLCPSPLPADCVKASFFIHQLRWWKKGRVNFE